MPFAVRFALILLWSAWTAAIAASINYYASLAALDFFDVGAHLLGYVILALLLLGIGARNAWARILFALILGWNLGLAAINLVLGLGQLPQLYWLDQLILAAQCAAAILLFVRPSNAWFRGTT